MQSVHRTRREGPGQRLGGGNGRVRVFKGCPVPSSLLISSGYTMYRVFSVTWVELDDRIEQGFIVICAAASDWKSKRRRRDWAGRFACRCSCMAFLKTPWLLTWLSQNGSSTGLLEPKSEVSPSRALSGLAETTALPDRRLRRWLIVRSCVWTCI